MISLSGRLVDVLFLNVSFCVKLRELKSVPESLEVVISTGSMEVIKRPRCLPLPDGAG